MEYTAAASSSQVPQSTTQSQPVIVQAAQAQPATSQAQVFIMLMYAYRCYAIHISYFLCLMLFIEGIPDSTRGTDSNCIQWI